MGRDSKCKRGKVHFLTRFLYLGSMALCAYAPLYIYTIIIVVLVVEYNLLIKSHFDQLNKLIDKNYEGSFVQRQILGFSLINDTFLSLGALAVLWFYRYNLMDYIGFQPDFSNFNNPLVFVFVLMKVVLLFSAIDRIHLFLVLRMFWGVYLNEPPLTRFIRCIIRNLKRSN